MYDLTSEKPVINFDSPETLNVISRLVDMARNGVIPPFEDPNGIDEQFAMVQEGHAALWMDLSGSSYRLWDSTDGTANFKVGVAPMPAIGKPLLPTYVGASLYISRSSKNPSACWEWITFLSAWPDAFLGIPARRSVLESNRLESIIGPDMAAAYRAVMAQPRQELMEVDERYPSAPLYVWWPDTLVSIFNGNPPEKALVELQDKAQAYLDCITTAQNPQTEDTWIACAKQADPEFTLPQDRPDINP